MKKLLMALILLSMWVSSFADEIQVKSSLSSMEQTLIHIFNPYVKRIGLKKITINQDFENTKYTGGVKVDDGEVKIVFGSEFSDLYPNLSEDGYAYILCHELGHILGETPEDIQQKNGQLSPEAESDYFSSAVCLKKLFRAYVSTELKIVDPIVKVKCLASYQLLSEQVLCERAAMAGIDFFTELHYSLKRIRVISDNDKFYVIPDLSKEDTQYYTFYPSLQCRAETVANGAICSTSEAAWENQASDWHCQQTHGKRPACWCKHP